MIEDSIIRDVSQKMSEILKDLAAAARRSGQSKDVKPLIRSIKRNLDAFRFASRSLPPEKCAVRLNEASIQKIFDKLDKIDNNLCDDQTPTFTFDGPDSLFGSTLEVGPVANSSETGSRDILVFDMNGNVSADFLSAFPLANPNTMTNFDPSMGDILGFSLVPGAGFPMSATFMVTTTFNCDNGTSSTSSSGSTSSSSSSGSTVTSGSSSGSSFTNSELISDAINFEVTAKNLINIKHLIEGMDISFSVQDAITKLNDATSDLNKLQKRFENNDIMIGMSSILTKLGDAINNDNEAIMVLEPFQNTTPDLTNGEFTKGLAKAKRLINEALRIKEFIEAKFKKLEKNDNKDK